MIQCYWYKFLILSHTIITDYIHRRIGMTQINLEYKIYLQKFLFSSFENLVDEELLTEKEFLQSISKETKEDNETR